MHDSALPPFCHRGNPWYTFAFVMEPHRQKLKKHKLLVIRQKEPVSQICVVSFSNFGNWITFGPLRRRCLFYIWSMLLITVNTFVVVIISFNIRKYAILFHFAWLNSKMLGFTLSLLYSHKSWTAALVCSLLSLLWTVHRKNRITVMQR